MVQLILKNCIQCDVLLTIGQKKFCSRSCSATYNNLLRPPKSIEIRNKISRSVRNSYIEKLSNEEERIKIKIRSRLVGDKLKQKFIEKILNADFNTLKFENLRKRVIYEQDSKCKNCQLNLWCGLPITFELNHIDGNNQNNIRQNLEALCPNCHSQTDTWRGKNFKNKGRKFGAKKVENEILLQALLNNNWNMRQALLEVKLAAKGGNYNRCHLLKREYEKLIQT